MTPSSFPPASIPLSSGGGSRQGEAPRQRAAAWLALPLLALSPLGGLAVSMDGGGYHSEGSVGAGGGAMASGSTALEGGMAQGAGGAMAGAGYEMAAGFWPVAEAPLNGICGSVAGQSLPAAPTQNLCAAGTAGSVGGNGPWSWNCAGSGGGATVQCSTSLASSGGGGAAGGAATPPAGGSVNINGTGGTISVGENGQAASAISMASGSQTQVNMPGGGTVGVASSGGQLTVERVQIGGQALPVLALAAGGATVTSSQAGQPLLSAGGITVVAGAAGSSSTARVDAQGHADIQVAPGDRVVVDSTTTDATLTLSQGGSVQIETTAGSVSIAPGSGGASVAFKTVDVNGVPTPVPTVVSGEVRVTVPASCAPMLSVNHTLVSAGTGNTQAEAGEGGGLVTVTLSAGQGLVGLCTGGNRMAAADMPIYTGESAEFTTDGVLQGIRLGSLHRNLGWTGDPLNLTGFGKAVVKADVAKIDGIANRLGANLAGAILGTLNQGTGHIWNYQSSGQEAASGVWPLRAQNPTGANDFLAVWPVGDIVVDQGGDSVRTSGNGMVQVRSGNLLASFAPALADPQGFAADVAASGADELVFQPDGTVQAVFGSLVYVVQPDWEIAPNTGRGFSLDGSGRLVWTDAKGNSQALAPAFADLGQLIAAFQKEDPGFAFQYAWRGEVKVVFLGVPMTLVPDSFMAPTPVAHKQDAWWIEGGKAYIRYSGFSFNGGSDFAQGFRVSLP